MTFSNTHWPQLTAPFYSILFETSICQLNSSKCSPIMPDEVREHLTRDQRPFLHLESLQVLQIHRSMTVLLQFTSLIFYRVQVREHLMRDQRSFLHPESLQVLQIHRSMMVLLQFTHSCSTGFRSENTWWETRDHSFIQNHFRFTDPWRCFFSSVHLTHVLQGSGQRTPDEISEIIPSSRITPDPLDSQIHDGASSLQFTSLIFYRVQVRDHLTRDQRHSFIQNHSRSFRFTDPWRCFFSSLTHVLQGSGQRSPDERPETFLHPESLQVLQIHRSMTVLLQFTHSSSTGFRSENTWWEIRDHSFIQNHSRSFRFTDPWRCFFSSLTHLLQGSGQRTPDERSEIIPSSRITPDPSDSQIHDGASSLQFTSLMFYRVQVREHLTRYQRSFLHPESLQILQIHRSMTVLLQFISLIFSFL